LFQPPRDCFLCCLGAAYRSLINETEGSAATFIALLSFTDQGIRNINDSPARAEAFRAMAGELGVTVKSFYWTLGNYDMVSIMEGTAEAVTSALMKVGSLGNVRSQTLQGFSADEFKQLVGHMS
jgi:uncharacterized protein with GYD domain